MPRIVAIVGRPNVGKSTLFNRLLQRREAIVDAVAGVTRDRHYGRSDWNGKDFSVIDTGGYIVGSDDVFEEEIRKQVLLALDEAHAILFVVDVEEGITELDNEIADILRKTEKPVYLVVNKVDNHKRAEEAVEFYSLGLGDYYNISATNGAGTGELLDDLVAKLPDEEEQQSEEDIPRFAIVGRPNVGKSSFVNALLGTDRNIVTDVAGTTRDSLETRYNQFGLDCFLVDTAGLRKRAKVHEDLEFYSVMRSVRAIEYSDVCLVLLDATRGIESQDLSIFHLAEKNRKGIVVVVNKWDLIEKDNHTMEQYKDQIKERLAPFHDLPILFTSALTKQRVLKAMEEATAVYHRRKQRISTSKLNDVMLEVVKHNPPPMYKGKNVSIKFITQLPTPTPQFVFFCNLPQYIKDPYKRWVEKQLREHFDFTGVPVTLHFRKK